ncbi:PHP domain-containing protein [Marinobacterium jannaschii]|uniref:PHP domain-containing protein n=1 Tax=Marinobacterium jannaschii TaxID=64970 RepID=UPI000486B1E9|nr:PHP domain-containing protein [Marinobacterium jannaschii]
MVFPRYDLHCHSTASDGALAPEALLSRALDCGIEVLALTDHDSVSGTRELLAQQVDDDTIRIITGTELSCLWNGRMVHIVGLGVDITDSALQSYLAEIDDLRQQRARRISERLVKQGLPDIWQEAQKLAAGGSIGRPHFARALVAAGAVKNENQVFKRYLGTGKPADVKMQWPEMSAAINVIRDSGGIAVLAHPTKYDMTFTKLRLLMSAFAEQGGQAIEVSYPGVSPDHRRELEKYASENGLMVSAGSDFHSPSYNWTELGRYPAVRSESNHVLIPLLGLAASE